jgi:hypothetical protein
MARSDKQLNVRLTPESWMLLDAVAYVETCTPGELTKRFVDEGLAAYADSPAVAKALEARREHQAEREGKLTHLGPKRSTRATSP